MKVAVTGSNGFIGGNLCRYLADSGISVKALVRSREKAALVEMKNVEPVIVDIVDPDSLKEAFSGVEVVFHLAALFNHPECSLEDYKQVNVTGTQNVLNAALNQGVRRVVHCSTVGVASSGGALPFSETTPYSYPEWDKYESTKCEAEKNALQFGKSNSLEVCVIRPAQVYGPGDRSKAKFYRMVKKGVIVNPGKTKKHPVYIDDLCNAFLLASKAEGVNGEVFIAGGSQSILLSDLIQTVARELNVPSPRFFIPAMPMTVLCTVVEAVCNMLRIKPVLFRRSMDFFIKSVEFDVSKARDMLNFQSQTSIEEGVGKTAHWYQSENLL